MSNYKICCAVLFVLALSMCHAESYSALTAFGSSSQNQNTDRHGSRRTRECKTDGDCAAIQNTTCMSDPRDNKMRCLCREGSAPINGACPNRPRGFRGRFYNFWLDQSLTIPAALVASEMFEKRKRSARRVIQPKTLGSPCNNDIECTEGTECRSLNTTTTNIKTCQCKEAFLNKDGSCNSAINLIAPSFSKIILLSLIVYLVNNRKFRLIQ